MVEVSNGFYTLLCLLSGFGAAAVVALVILAIDGRIK
ncbi:hypothetical protein AAM22_gp23 [Pantoea phage vB_PagM_AAM22]|nr:hypothetical protein AAM22_gp23 [Pantoea phage vB_PagM_AAM22]